MSEIHPSSVVHPEARLGKNVKIGPLCVVGPHVEIGDNCTLHAHVVVDGHTKIGKNNEFYQFGSIGAPPQDISYKNEPTRVEIGDNNIFREFNSVHRGTLKQDQVTKIGNNNLFMSYVHIGHDCTIGNNVRIVNSCNLGGHCNVANGVIISGATSLSQFVSLGRNAFIGGGSAVDRDIPDFCTAFGNRVRLKGINIIGMKRSGFTKQDVSEVVDFYRTMESSALSPRAFVDHEELMQEYKNNAAVKGIADFIRKSEIGIPPFMS
ncbi:MAG: acyl-ACP--UDP-N-acetylglucosamine O-acyltransferase [Bacteriovoracaceae bacterium]|nr:acyl-ACP--UDP-N-acetylglucosamine O-acyltransferase [Bacteriovoracaceae bacterium]